MDIFNPEIVTSYTRNPSVLRLLDNIGGDVFDNDNKQIALSMNNAVKLSDGNIYHIDRFGPNGLYGTNDPAEQLYNDEIFMNKFIGLKNTCNALALAVKVKRGQ